MGDTSSRMSAFHALWDDFFWQVCSSHEPSILNPRAIGPSPLRLQIDFGELNSGDILCSCLETLRHFDVWIILHPVDVTHQTYQLVGTQESNSALSKLVSKEQHTESFLQCPKIKLRII